MARATLLVIDVGHVDSSEELHALLRDKLHFPDWYGANWDAFWDSITSLVEMPQTLRLVGWHTLAVRLPRDARLLQSSLTEMETEYPKLASHVLYV